jgi:hypothetical protein
LANLEAKGFTLGLTDDVETQDPREFVEGDNLTIEYPSGDLASRGGSVIKNEVTPRLTERRVNNALNFGDDDRLLAVSEAKLFEDQGVAGIVEIPGPTGNQAFAGASEDLIACPAEHDEHMYLACDDDDQDGPLPLKIYKDENDAVKVVTAGLPKMAYNFPIAIVEVSFLTLANDIRTQFLDHYADGARHPTAADVVSAALITAPALILGDSLETMIVLVKQLMAAYHNHYADLAKPVPDRSYHSKLVGENPAPNVPLYDDSEPITFQDCALRLNDLKRRHNWHMRSYQGHPSVGPDLVTAASIPGCNDPYQASSFFQDLDYEDLISVAILLYGKFLLHRTDQSSLGIAHSLTTLYNITNLLDTVHAPNVNTANDLDSLIELVTQLYGAIRDHVADGTGKAFRFNGTTAIGSPQITAIAPIVGQGQFSDIKDGMYAGDFSLVVRLPQNITVVPGSKTDAGGIGDPQLQVTANATAAAAAGITFTRSLYHWKLHAGATNIPQSDIDAMTPSEAITVAQAANNLTALREMLMDLVAKYNYHDGPTSNTGSLHANAGLQQVQIPETIPATPQDVRQYIYGFVFRRPYKTSDGLLREDVSSVFLKTKFGLRTIEDSPTEINLAQLKTIVNGGTLNYDTANTVIDIYRTADTSIILRKTGTAPLGTAIFIDTVSDAELASRQPLYTTGGVVDNDPPPIAKVMHIHQGFGYYGNLKVGDEYFPNDIGQSIAEDIDSVPESFRVKLPRPVIGISSTPRDVIGWTKSGTYRLEGTFDERGQGGIFTTPISEQIGLVGGLSPVQVDQGVVFAGSDGFYLTDGYKLIPLAHRFQETYSRLITTAARSRKIQGTYDKANQLIMWTCCLDEDENDVVFVLHFSFGVGPHGGSFTTWSGGADFRPTAITMFQGKLIRGDSRGYLLEHNQDSSDPKIDTALDPSEWETQAIIFDYISPAFEFGTNKIKKWVTKIITTLYNVGKTSLRISRINDNGKSTKECRNIRFSGVPTGSRIEKRAFPAGNLRCMSMQVRMCNAADGQPDEKSRLHAYSIQYALLGDSFSDAGDDQAELDSA